MKNLTQLMRLNFRIEFFACYIISFLGKKKKKRKLLFNKEIKCIVNYTTTSISNDHF